MAWKLKDKEIKEKVYSEKVMKRLHIEIEDSMCKIIKLSIDNNWNYSKTLGVIKQELYGIFEGIE